MVDQAARLEVIVDKAEQGMEVIRRFSNDPVGAGEIPTESGDIKNLQQVSEDIKADGREAIGVAVEELVDYLKSQTQVNELVNALAGEALSAGASADRAELSASAAAATANQYLTIDEGLQKTSGTGSTNRLFSVPESGNYFSVQYLNNGGTPLVVGRSPSAEYVATLNAKLQNLLALFGSAPEGFSLMFNDKVGQGAMGIKDTGVVVAGALELMKLSSQTLSVPGGGAIGLNQIPGYVLSLMSGIFDVCLGIKVDGTLQAGRVEVKRLISDLVEAVNFSTQSITLSGGEVIGAGKIPGYEWHLLDAFFNACFAIEKNGTVHMGTLKANKIQVGALELDGKKLALTGVAASIKRTLPDIPHIFCYGQSLSTGVNASPLLTLINKYGALMFSGGVRPQDGGADSASNHAGFLAYLEKNVNTGDGNGWETPMGGLLECMYERLLEEHADFKASDVTFLGSAPGQGGKTIAQLSKGHPLGYYNRIIDGIQHGYANAQALGKTYEPIAACWVQGESDQSAGTTPAAYKAALVQLIEDVNADASALLGFPVQVKWVTYQFNSWINRSPNVTYPTIPLALQELAKERDDLTMACPMYQFDYADAAHLVGASSKALGAYMGLAIKRAVLEEVEFEPLWPLSHIKQGKVVNLKFKPVGKLVLDAEWVANPGNYGFSLVDSAGNNLPLTSVSVRYDTVSIIAAQAIPAGAKLRYAFIGGTTNLLPSRTQGPRGNLRDSQGDEIVFDADGISWPLHNWAMPFELAL